MPLFFEVLDNDVVKATYNIRHGLKIGRTKGEILLQDSKVSSLHAIVQRNAKNQLILVDNNSANGIRVNMRRVSEVLLLPGITVQIGRMQLRVNEQKEEIFTPEVEDWRDSLQKILSNERERFEVSHNEKIKILRPALRLKFVEGLQLNAEWTLGYGPRMLGRESLDLTIYEADIPDQAFFVEPGPDDHPRFRTDHPDQVRYNGQKLKESKMKTGDFIQLGKTKILVEMEK